MYVCICHAIRESDVRRVVCDGEITMAGVYKRLGCRPRCGTCVGTMAQTIAETVDEQVREPQD